MRIRWTPAAAADLEQIKDYLTGAYARVCGVDCSAALRFDPMPNRGRNGRETGTRELVLTPLPYIVVYRVNGDAVEILHLHHGAQDSQ